MDAFSEYLAKIENPQHRTRTEEVLKWVTESFAILQPKIAWNQPMFTHHGTFIIGFSVAKQHLAVAPESAGINRFSNEILRAGLNHSKQLVRFEWNKPVDFALLRQIIAFNIEDKADCLTFWRK